ncbi:hypothetical protein [Vibrio phage 2 TSL-2019]|uniref:Uncharacterized protein n=1 Tax=Vibrio phage 2 TSL-2019 TaxID=2508172 RepID=A0A513PWK7_9CAUD|nr:hypothetical protein HWC03_gp092 [Vibrio phage 2 TSL-2019]QAU04247.1 hypothetical protein [Vibrio phage 2 TSL-2019]
MNKSILAALDVLATSLEMQERKLQIRSGSREVLHGIIADALLPEKYRVNDFGYAGSDDVKPDPKYRLVREADSWGGEFIPSDKEGWEALLEKVDPELKKCVTLSDGLIIDLDWANARMNYKTLEWTYTFKGLSEFNIMKTILRPNALLNDELNRQVLALLNDVYGDRDEDQKLFTNAASGVLARAMQLRETLVERGLLPFFNNYRKVQISWGHFDKLLPVHMHTPISLDDTKELMLSLSYKGRRLVVTSDGVKLGNVSGSKVKDINIESPEEFTPSVVNDLNEMMDGVLIPPTTGHVRWENLRAVRNNRPAYGFVPVHVASIRIKDMSGEQISRDLFIHSKEPLEDSVLGKLSKQTREFVSKETGLLSATTENCNHVERHLINFVEGFALSNGVELETARRHQTLIHVSDKRTYSFESRKDSTPAFIDFMHKLCGVELKPFSELSEEDKARFEHYKLMDPKYATVLVKVNDAEYPDTHLLDCIIVKLSTTGNLNDGWIYNAVNEII